MSGTVVTPVTNILPHANYILRLADFSGCDGILQSIQPSDDGWILAALSGILVELPSSLEAELRALMGQPTRAAQHFGAYRVARWTGRATA